VEAQDADRGKADGAKHDEQGGTTNRHSRQYLKLESPPKTYARGRWVEAAHTVAAGSTQSQFTVFEVVGGLEGN
jgi:hypothetical protein